MHYTVVKFPSFDRAIFVERGSREKRKEKEIEAEEEKDEEEGEEEGDEDDDYEDHHKEEEVGGEGRDINR